MVGGYLDAVWRWVLLDGNRNLLAGLITTIVFLGCLVAVATGLLTVEDTGPVRALLSAIIGGMVSFITIVVAIDQLILTQTFGTPGAFKGRLTEMEEFRRKVEYDADLPISPAEPSAFLREQLEATLDCTERLRENTGGDTQLTRFIANLARGSAKARRRLQEIADTNSFELLSVSIDFDASYLLHRLRSLRATGDVPSDATEGLDNLEALLEDVHITGLYFKSVNVQQELADLSKLLLYVGTGALLYGGFIVTSYENVLAATPGRVVLILVICAALTAAFAPFAVLLSHVMRIATVARRTSADFGPFLLQRQIPDEEQ